MDEAGVSIFFSGIRTPGGTATAGNEGVGEHVRTKSRPAKGAGEIADLWIRTDEENFFLLPSRFSSERTPSKYGATVWPDVSPTPSFVDQSRR
jgi:hypothetical protein